MAKKRTSLDTLSLATSGGGEVTAPEPRQAKGETKRPGIKQQTAYLPEPVYELLRSLAFEERAKMHDYLMEGLDLVFQKRGLPSISELTGKQG